MKVDGSISSLIQGVSQQPSRERLPGQCTLQENFSSDPVNGLTRRAPTQFIKQMLSGSGYMFVDYDGGSLGRFIIAHKVGSLRVFDLTGTEYTVTVSSGLDYVNAGDMQFIGIDENIYCVNTDKVVLKKSDTKAYYDNVGFLYSLGGAYGHNYTITIIYGSTTITATYQTPNGSSTSHATQVTPSNIMFRLTTDIPTGLVNDTNFTTNFDYGNSADVFWFRPKPASGITTYSVTAKDDQGGTTLRAFVNKIDDVEKLPAIAPHRSVVEVTGSGSAEADNWYLEFLVETEVAGSNTLGASFGKEGKWVETVAPGIPWILDETTLPHVLKKIGPTEFSYGPATWDNREVGDETTNPMPSFVDHTLSDVGTFQGRLVFLSDVNCIMSRTNKHTNFFSQTATAQLDDDPIDVSSALGTFQLKSLVPHNRDLVIFSDAAQFIVFGRNALTPKNCSLVLTTEFEADLRAEPTAAGRNIFFAFKYGTFTGIQEFYTEGGEDVNNSRPITQNVLQYIKGAPMQMVSTTNFNKLLVRTALSKQTVYVYEYIWLDEKKAQSSWSTWTFPKDIEYAFFVDNLLYMIVLNDTGYSLQSLDLDDTPDDGITYRPCLDEKVFLTNVHLTATLPYTVSDIDDYVAVQGDDCPFPGLQVPITSVVGTTATFAHDMAGGEVIFGRKYLSRYIPTSPFVRDRDGVKIGSGKLTIKQFVLHFNKTGYIQCLITDNYGYSASVEYKGRVLGSPNNIVGQAAVSDGSFPVPFKKNPDNAQLEVRTDSHLPLSLLEAEWTGQWLKKGQRITGG